MSEFAIAEKHLGSRVTEVPLPGLPTANVALDQLIRAAATQTSERAGGGPSVAVTAVERRDGAALRPTREFSKTELLASFLARFMPVDAARAEAEALLARYGSLGGVVAAPTERLAEQIGSAEAAHFIEILRQIATEIVREPIAEGTLIDTPTALDAYLRVSLRHETVECVRLLFLSSSNRLRGEEVHSRGTINHCPLYPREVVRRVIEMNANALIIVHNHPCGDPAPSRQDTEMTQLLAQTLARIGVSLHDHVIVGANGNYSFRAHGLLAAGLDGGLSR